MNTRPLDLQILVEGAARLGLPLPPETLPRFAAFGALLEKWGAALRLTGLRDPLDWVETHFLDSLTPLPHLSGARSLLDIGSGAGFPGIPLALLRDDWQVTLLESIGKKTTFLKTAVHDLGLSHATVLQARAEENPERRFDAVISRAVCAPNQWLPLAAPWTTAGGCVITMLGREQPPRDELARLGERHGATLEAIHELHLPRSGSKRALVLWRRDA